MSRSSRRLEDPGGASDDEDAVAALASSSVDVTPDLSRPNAPPPQDADAPEDGQAAGSVHHAQQRTTTFAPPIVTKETRRETFALTTPFASSGKIKEKRHPVTRSPSSSAPPVRPAAEDLSSSSGDEDDESMLDLFSPPPSTTLRARPRPTMRMDDPRADTYPQSEGGAPPEEEDSEDEEGSRYRQRHTISRSRPITEYPSFQSPPTIYTPHTAMGDRMAMSTTQKRHYEGRVVHVPKSREDEPGSYDDEEEGVRESIEGVGQQTLHSAPPRMPVSRHAMAYDRGGAEPDGSCDFEPHPKEGIGYDSNEEIHAALQLSFEDSPDHTLKSSPEEAPRTSSQHHLEQHASEGGYPGQQQQHQAAPYPYHPAYQPHHHPAIGAASGYHHYPPSSSPHGVPFPGYPPPPAAGYPSHQWPSASAPPGQHPGYYGMYPPQHPHYQQQEQQGHYRVPPPSETPSGSRTPAKRKGLKNIDANATMTTTESSYDEEEMGGPLSPPSSKKKRDSEARYSASSSAWGSPQREFARGAIEREYDTTPQRGSTIASRKRQGDAAPAYQAAAVTHSSSFGGGEIFNADSWSPSHMHAFFGEEGESAGDGNNDSSSPQYQPRFQSAQGSPLRSSFRSAASPSQDGITIRGSPIMRKTDRGDANAAVAETYRSESHSTPARGDQTPSGHSWQKHSAAAGMRVKIGSVGMDTTEVRRGIEGINSVLRGSPVSAPKKKSLGRHEPPVAAIRFNYAPDATSMAGYTTTPTRRGPHNMPQRPGWESPATSARRGTGKENAENDSSSQMTCTCKNSKCLKLYCVCFAAEKYCHGCKCNNCQNTPQFEAIRNKAIADTVAKNPKAFKEKMSETTHAIGCKCKKSSCLKKYCECFQGSVVCGPKCKCVNCKNYVGSQALIDRRRKIKDHKGAETAMISAEQAWKGGPDMLGDGTIVWAQSPIVHEPLRGMPTGPMKTSPLVAFGSSPHHPGYHPSHYPHSAGMIQQSPMMYHGMAPPHPIYSVSMADSASRPQQQHQPWSAPQKPSQRYSRHYVASKPRTHSFQRRLDDVRSKETSEGKEPYFGPDVPSQTKTTALMVFSYLTNDDLFNASIVSKRWCNVSFDKALWTSDVL